MKLDAYIVCTIRPEPLMGRCLVSCKDVEEMLDVGVPAMQRVATCGIEILKRVEAEEVNTWDVYTIFGERYFGSGDSGLIVAECRDGFAFKQITAFQELGADMHIYAYRHCSLESFRIQQ